MVLTNLYHVETKIYKAINVQLVHLHALLFLSVSKISLLWNWIINQINHSPDITTEDYAYEIKGAGLFSRDLLFSLWTPVPVKAGEQVKVPSLSYFRTSVTMVPKLHAKTIPDGEKIFWIISIQTDPNISTFIQFPNEF